MTKQNETYDSVLKAWNDSQQKLLGLWSDWLNTSAGSMSALLQEPFNPLQGPDRAGESGDSTLGDRTAVDYLAGQGAIKDLIELSLGVWKTAISSETNSEQWAERARDFAQQWVDNSLKLLLAFGEEKDSKPHLWKVFLGQLPGLPALLGVPPQTPAEAAAQDDAGHYLWLTLQDGWDPLPWLAGEIAHLPHVGAVDTTVSRKLLQGFEAWYAFVTTEQKHQLIRLKAWSEAALRASRRLADMRQAGKSITTSREWLMLWIDAGDDVLIDMYRSEAYLKIQRELMTATMRYKKWLQEFGGLILEAYGCPTRAELDDAYRSIYELRREVRALKKDLRARAAAETAKPKTTPRRKKAAHSAAKSTPRKASPPDT